MYSQSMNETQLQQHTRVLVTESTTLEAKLNTDVKALDVGSVITKSNGTKSDKHDTSSSSGTYITHAVDADIRPVNDQVPFAEVQLTAQHNVLANEQQHTEQSEPIYDTYLLEKVDSNTTPDSTNMCHRGGKIDQDADAPEFCEFFEINDLKAQLQAKTTLICNLKNQIKSVKEASNEAKTKDHNDSLIAQVNSKTVENADLKAQIQEKIAIGQRFSLNKSSAVHEKPNTPRSCLRWIPTGRIFKLAGLRWIPTRKLFDSCTSKVDSEPPNGSNEDITNPYECKQTLNVSACTLNLSAGHRSFNDRWRSADNTFRPSLPLRK
ncbi:hypothetical protein Tco_0992617 [Tanacetum coccineum]|uniref:Uncharacterized protein n=1 Tax=Tanacetum coccineum TaxID=301880 RepID=A0ABQ5F3A7_9ASTR